MRTNYCERGGLQVSVGTGAADRAGASLPSWDWTPRASGTASPRCWMSSCPVNQALLGRRDELQREIDAWHRARRGQPFDVVAHEAHLRQLWLPGSRRSGLSHRHAQCRCRDRAARRSAAGRAAQQCALRAQCRQCPLGQSLRCLLWHRCDRGNRKSGARQELQPGPWPRSDRARARVAGSGRAAVVRQSSERNRLRDCGRCSPGHAERWHADHACQAVAVQRLPGRGVRADRTVVRASWPAHRGAHRSRASDRPRRRGRHSGCPARIGADHDHGSRGLHRGGRQRGQGGRVSQLARA